MAISKAQQKELKRLGQRLKSIRVERGLTLKELGYKIDKDPQSISRVEMGDINATFLYLLEVCKGLDISMEDLFRIEKD